MFSVETSEEIYWYFCFEGVLKKQWRHDYRHHEGEINGLLEKNVFVLI